MLTVDHYARIRQLHRDGLTIREIADQRVHGTTGEVPTLTAAVTVSICS